MKKLQWKIVLLVAGLLGVQGFADRPCSGFWAGWKNYEPRFTLVGNKKVPLDSSYDEFHHLFLVRVDSVNRLKISALPAFVSKKTKDTSYSASDGGFFSGRGQCFSSSDSLYFSGRYTSAYLANLDDSTFNIGMKRNKVGYQDRKMKIVFKEIDEKAFAQYFLKWGMKYAP